VINSSCAEPGFFATRNSDVAPAAKSLIVFLKQLEDYGEFVSDVTTVRRRTARAKCREVPKQLQPGRAVNAATVAEKARVSLTTMHRSLAVGLLDMQRPTPHGIRICHWSAIYRKKRLTVKRSRKHC